MRMRALPKSFWQQPNVPQNVSPAMAYPILPPLVNSKDEDQISGEPDFFLFLKWFHIQNEHGVISKYKFNFAFPDLRYKYALLASLRNIIPKKCIVQNN